MTEFEKALLEKVDILTNKVDTLQNEVNELKAVEVKHANKFESFVKAISNVLSRDKKSQEEKLEEIHHYLTHNLSYLKLIDSSERGAELALGVDLVKMDKQLAGEAKLVAKDLEEIKKLIQNNTYYLSSEISMHGIR